jgi:hypothetical protein
MVGCPTRGDGVGGAESGGAGAGAGKYLELRFEFLGGGGGPRLRGALVRTYLLEASRVSFGPMGRVTRRTTERRSRLCVGVPVGGGGKGEGGGGGGRRLEIENSKSGRRKPLSFWITRAVVV